MNEEKVRTLEAEVAALRRKNHRLEKALRDLVRMDLTDGFSFVAWEHAYGGLLPKKGD
jgi:hypothetical protein